VGNAFEEDPWDLGRFALWLLAGVTGFSVLVAGVRRDTESTSGWPAPAQLDGRHQRDPVPSARPGTSGWTPPSQLQRAVHPDAGPWAPPETSGWTPPSQLQPAPFSGSRAAPDR
jgi:hypothetical protein